LACCLVVQSRCSRCPLSLVCVPLMCGWLSVTFCGRHAAGVCCVCDGCGSQRGRLRASEEERGRGRPANAHPGHSPSLRRLQLTSGHRLPCARTPGAHRATGGRRPDSQASGRSRRHHSGAIAAAYRQRRPLTSCYVHRSLAHLIVLGVSVRAPVPPLPAPSFQSRPRRRSCAS
jgi:hypothetical protein